MKLNIKLKRSELIIILIGLEIQLEQIESNELSVRYLQKDMFTHNQILENMIFEIKNSLKPNNT